ncbi:MULTISPECIES: hypothetical protein [Komagataeibacter]|uniref:Uncharacterized protein n=1 Tax=Komagataeibacter oboediens TaxID=65958 RepID=A0A318QQQ3_9PROT|nr:MULTISPECIES: hypothetical protein [Komagataeibacter]PYD79788.1 hypothetical protein CFR80_14640 [Komagataeibacter oboediens]GBQ47008.1 hypothetical protein AA18890_2704 [Komagataeibacter europaeus LMG 18890]
MEVREYDDYVDGTRCWADIDITRWEEFLSPFGEGYADWGLLVEKERVRALIHGLQHDLARMKKVSTPSDRYAYVNLATERQNVAAMLHDAQKYAKLLDAFDRNLTQLISTWSELKKAGAFHTLALGMDLAICKIVHSWLARRLQSLQHV